MEQMTIASPKVTVLIGTYNRPDYLREAIRSVIHQTMRGWELLVMNDGGVNVEHVVQEFQDGRISYFNDDINKGLAVRLNFGLNKARGKYIAYLGDDDLWYPNHLEVLSKALDEDSQFGAVYSDLYGVQCVKDEITGKRFPLNKFVQASRDYNRDAIFCFNHVLHVSLMHRKELGLRVGGYDETIKVLIDWNMTRKLSFYTDFKHISRLTGEYYMPIRKSDRISNLERQDNERYKHNLRKIMADHPPEPWAKVARIGIIFPVSAWDDATTSILTDLTDRLFYPVRFILVNNDLTKDKAACRKILGKISELKNISIHTPPRPLKELDAYRFGAEKVKVDYVYLLTKNVDTKLDMRLLSAKYFFERKHCEGVKWDVEQEKKGPFDLLMRRDLFLKRSAPGNTQRKSTLDIVPKLPPESLRCDLFFQKASTAQEAGNYELAYQFYKEAEAVKEGGAGEQYSIDLYARICFDLGKYDEAEQKCRELIEKGYGADNWIRLGRILQWNGKYEEAIEAFKNGLQEIGLKYSDLKNSVFPIAVSDDFGSFSAFIGLGECMLETDNLTESFNAFHRASRLKANSHKPFLGFGKLFLKANDLKQAEEALLTASKMKEEAEIYRLLGHIYEKKGQPKVAFDCYLRAFKSDPKQTENTLTLYQLGKALDKWDEMKRIFEECLESHPEAFPAGQYLSDIYTHLRYNLKPEIFRSEPSVGQ